MKASQKQKIYTSLATVDKAVNAQIYFEILYLHYFDTHLNHAPSREQRKQSMEIDSPNPSQSGTEFDRKLLDSGAREWNWLIMPMETKFDFRASSCET